MRPPRIALLPLLFATLLPAPAAAWGDAAHRAVGALAQARLEPAAGAEVARLLAPEGTGRLADVANWADDLRDGDDPRARRSARWHYVNLGPGCAYTPARDCPQGDCAIGAIQAQLAVLRDRRQPDGARRDALKFVVHLVGDLHQPLHATGRDKGGNLFQVQVGGRGSNLHQVWDRELPKRAIRAAGGEAAWERRLAGLRLPADAAARGDQPVVQWAAESCRLVDEASLFPSGHVIGADYLDARAALADARVRRAGDRLAALLNAALGGARGAGP